MALSAGNDPGATYRTAKVPIGLLTGEIRGKQMVRV
jgi:hypothetical protein